MGKVLLDFTVVESSLDELVSSFDVLAFSERNFLGSPRLAVKRLKQRMNVIAVMSQTNSR